MNVQECLHSIQFGGLCALCGRDMTVSTKQQIISPLSNTAQSVAPLQDVIDQNESEPLKARHFILHSDTNLRVTDTEAARLEAISMDRLMEEQKLSLVIDLDQTILHASIDPSVKDEFDALPVESPVRSEIHLLQLPKNHFVKLRPGLFQFLQQMQLLYEMHIYTMGSRDYAQCIAGIVDPKGEFFADRIVTRDENELMHQKSLKRLFPVNDNIAVIIDDRVDVWGDCDNLLQVKPYCFFRGVQDINDPFGRQIERMNGNSSIIPQDDDDSQLIVIARILRELHQKYFLSYPGTAANVPVLLQCMKGDVLKDKFLVFTGLFPSNQDAYKSELWKNACKYGAICSQDLRRNVTHLVVGTQCASGMVTDKMKKAFRMKNIFILTVDWLYECFSQWKAVNEQPYLINVPTSLTESFSEQLNTENVFSSDFSESSDFEDFLDEEISSVATTRSQSPSAKKSKIDDFDEDSFLEELENELYG